jgi:hypothetical protein
MPDQSQRQIPNQTQVRAQILERVRVLKADKPGIAVVEFQVRGGKSALFAVSRKAMLEIAEHLQKEAQNLAEPKE